MTDIEAREITVSVITEHFKGDQNWRAFVPHDPDIQAEGETPEAATQALIPEIKYFIQDPKVDPAQQALHRDLLENAPEIGVTQVTINLSNNK